MRMFIVSAFCISAFLSLAADGGIIQKSLSRVNKELAACLEKGDATGVSNCYTKDAEFMAPNAPMVKGRERIATVFGQLITNGMTEMTLVTTQVWGTGALVAEEGIYSLETEDGKVKDKGKYIVLWKLEAGHWKIYRDIFNSDLANKN